MKNLLIVLFSVLSAFSVNAQVLDISNGSFRIDDSTVIVSDTLEIDLTGVMIYDIYNSNKGDLLDMLSLTLDMGLTRGPDNSKTDLKTDWDFFIDDIRMYRHRKRIHKEIKTKLSDKVVIFYHLDEVNKRNNLYRLDI